MKRGLLALIPALALAGEAELVRGLGSPSFDEREAAQAALLPLGEKAWPELEKALQSPEMEVRDRAEALLRAWGWIPPPLRSPETAALRARDPERRKAAVEHFLEKGLRDPLELALAGKPIRLGLALTPGKRTFGTGQEAAIEGEVKNLSPHPGWLPTPHLETAPGGIRPFGREVRFPAPRTGGRKRLSRFG